MTEQTLQTTHQCSGRSRLIKPIEEISSQAYNMKTNLNSPIITTIITKQYTLICKYMYIYPFIWT